MQHEFPILINITVALLAAFIGGLLARRLKLPPMVGYMLAGVAIGPFTPGFSGDLFTIQQLAELGVIFLLFDVGLHFSLRDLWAVRDTVISGALIQMVLITGLGLLLAHLWGWSLAAGIRSEEHTSELQSRLHLVCRLLLEKKKRKEMIRAIQE